MKHIHYKDHLITIERIHSGTKLTVMASNGLIYNKLMIDYTKKELITIAKDFINNTLRN